MKLKQDVISIYQKISLFESGQLNITKLASGAYYLDDELTLITDPVNSGARFPYAVNGMTIWAYASGYISINHSSYYILPPNLEGKEPFLDFFGIEQDGNNTYPVSLLGVSERSDEIENKRYTVFSKNIAYYITVTKNFLYAVTVYISKDFKIYFNTVAHNLTGETKQITLSSFFNMLFKYDSGESIETKWFKKVSYENNMFIYDAPEDIDRHTRIENYGVVKRHLHTKPKNIQNTTSRIDYVGKRYRSVRNALSIRSLKFEKAPLVTNFTDTAINADLINYEVKAYDTVITSYRIETCHDKDTLNKMMASDLTDKEIKKVYEGLSNTQSYDFDNFGISFKGVNDNRVDDKVLNQFLKLVNYQIHFSSLSSNSGTIFLGVRDVMQQLESSLIWDRKNVRSKILEVLSFIDPSGLPPRQYALPPKEGNPRMDLRPFIDQGLWIISTLHTYLAYTEDYDILNEVCGYYERIEPNSAKKSKLENSVLEHLIRVTNYLVSNIDPSTYGLKALYGDWNDALDGLGLIEGSSGYGNGVSVMATLQLYENLERMIEILKLVDPQNEHINTYEVVRHNLSLGINKYAVVIKQDEKRVLHGWGHDRSYFVGSFNDPDGHSRNSLTSNAFYIISNMIQHNPDMKHHLLSAFHNLDSKYGLKTFDPAMQDFHGFGRIINLPPGTAENAATYVHATLFGVLALYMLGEGDFANEQVLKVLPITKKEMSTSPFIMPNSYVYNEDLNMDGESMSDWYTGSANTLLKTLIRGLFGLEVKFDHFRLRPSKAFFSKEATLIVSIGNKLTRIEYRNTNTGNRTFKFNGKAIEAKLDDLSGLLYIDIDKSLLEHQNVIHIED